MTDLAKDEFVVLRETIRDRGSARVWLFWATITVWAALTLVVAGVTPLPIVALVPLLVLSAGFEAIHALHAGVERIGRYLEVFYEAPEPGAPLPAWERTVMAFGRRYPTGGTDPLFVATFAIAACLNMIPVMLAEPTRVELIVVAIVHMVFIVRLLLARRQAAAQRALDLERFRMLASRPTDAQSSSGSVGSVTGSG